MISRVVLEPQTLTIAGEDGATVEYQSFDYYAQGSASPTPCVELIVTGVGAVLTVDPASACREHAVSVIESD